jgi:hypothetical protein
VTRTRGRGRKRKGEEIRIAENKAKKEGKAIPLTGRGGP